MTREILRLDASCAHLGRDARPVLVYLADALREDDPACLAFALAQIARSRDIALLAALPPAQKENAPYGAFLALPWGVSPRALIRLLCASAPR